MKTYKIELLNETLEIEANSIGTALSRAIREFQKKKIFKDKIGLWLRIDIERVK